MSRPTRGKVIQSRLTILKRIPSSAVLSGVLVGTSFIPFPPWALLFCMVPLWVGVLRDRGEGFWKGFFRGWWTQSILTLVGFYWIAYVSHEYGYMTWPVSIFVLLLFASTVHLYFPLATGVTQWLEKKFNFSLSVRAGLLATLTGLGEIFWPSLFPWNLGYSFLWIGSPVAQTADVIGFQGLSAIVLFANAGLAWAFCRWRETGKFIYVLGKLLAMLAVFTGLYSWGLHQQEKWKNPDTILQVLQVQGNISNLDKLAAEKGAGFGQSVIDTYFNLTREGLFKHPKADLIIWPETAYPDYLNPAGLSQRTYGQQFIDFLLEIKKPLITGAFSRAQDSTEKRQPYNGFFLYSESAHLWGSPYHKVNRLIFGEYTPFVEYIPFLAQLSPAGFGWSAGPGPQVIPFGDYFIGPQICYDSLYPEFSTEMTQQGADILINLTNDSWFGPTSEPHQHMLMTMGRAIETRRPLLRTTNTGITSAILADGTFLEKSTLFTPWYGMYEIHFKKQAPKTFYSDHPQWVTIFLVFILIALLTIGFGRFVREKSRLA